MPPFYFSPDWAKFLTRLAADMKEQFVYDPLISKRQQYLLATQLVRAVLKIGSSPSCFHNRMPAHMPFS